MALPILELDRLIESIDAAADKAVASSAMFTPERKRRVVSDMRSALPPPQDAPKWAIKAVTVSSEGTYMYIFYVWCLNITYVQEALLGLQLISMNHNSEKPSQQTLTL